MLKKKSVRSSVLEELVLRKFFKSLGQSHPLYKKRFYHTFSNIVARKAREWMATCFQRPSKKMNLIKSDKLMV